MRSALQEPEPGQLKRPLTAFTDASSADRTPQVSGFLLFPIPPAACHSARIRSRKLASPCRTKQTLMRPCSWHRTLRVAAIFGSCWQLCKKTHGPGNHEPAPTPASKRWKRKAIIRCCKLPKRYPHPRKAPHHMLRWLGPKPLATRTCSGLLVVQDRFSGHCTGGSRSQAAWWSCLCSEGRSGAKNTQRLQYPSIKEYTFKFCRILNMIP